VGYRGLIELAYRSGAIASLNADVVYRQEIEAGLFSYSSGIRPTIEHRIDLLDGSARSGNPQDIVAAYACAVLKSGEPVIRVVPRRDIDKAMAMSGGKSGPSDVWKTHYAEMAIKTAIHRLAKWLPTTRVDEAMDAEAKYIEAEAKAVEPAQSGLSLEAINAMMQAGQGVAVEAPQEAPAVEQAPAPEPVQAQPEPVKPAPAPEPKPEPERPAAFRPAEPQNVDSAWDDFWADRDGDGEPEAREVCWKAVQEGKAKDMTEAKAQWLSEAQKMDNSF
jgi:recombination protein RecT